MRAGKWQLTDFSMKKSPSQARSRASVDAMVQAAARILAEQGYAGLTTNAVARVAGVSIGSLYEYFPGKEAIVARLVDDLLAETLTMLHGQLDLTDNRNDLAVAMRHFLRALHGVMRKHHRLLRVLVFQVPYLHQLPATLQLQRALQDVLQRGLEKAQQHYRVSIGPHTLYLMATSTGGSLLHLVLMTPPSMPHEPVIDALADRMVAWLLEGE